jgi:hypothetical protein
MSYDVISSAAQDSTIRMIDMKDGDIGIVTRYHWADEIGCHILRVKNEFFNLDRCRTTPASTIQGWTDQDATRVRLLRKGETVTLQVR